MYRINEQKLYQVYDEKNLSVIIGKNLRIHKQAVIAVENIQWRAIKPIGLHC